MKDYWLWIGGTMIFLNFANFGDEYCQTASLGILCDADADV